MEKIYTVDLNKAWKLSKLWKNLAIMWRVFEHIFVIGSFIAAVFIVYMSSSEENFQMPIIIISSISAIFSLMDFALSPANYMVNYRAAFEILNTALVSSVDKDGNLVDEENNWKKICEAIIEGEKCINKIYNFSTTDIYTNDEKDGE